MAYSLHRMSLLCSEVLWSQDTPRVKESEGGWRNKALQEAGESGQPMGCSKPNRDEYWSQVAWEGVPILYTVPIIYCF